MDYTPNQQRELLAHLLQERVGRPRVYPLSFSQESLWFLEQLHPNSAAYHIPLALRLRGELDIRALEEALHTIIQRHDALRSVIVEQDGAAKQLVKPQSDLTLVPIDLTAIPDDERDLTLEQSLAEVCRHPFVFDESLFRASLFKLAADEHVLLVDVHHLVFDGWSAGVFFAELGTWYRAAMGHQHDAPPDPRIRYSDYVRWQRRLAQENQFQPGLAYWRQHLTGAPSTLQLPADRRPAARSGRGVAHSFDIEPEMAQRLHRLVSDEQVTSYMLLLAAFQALLYRYSGQPDLVVGVPFACRNRREVEGLVGMLVNTLPLRTQIAGNRPFRELLNRTRKVVLDAHRYQDIPFEMIVADLRPERILGQNPLYQVVFDLQDEPIESLKLPLLETAALYPETGAAIFNLTCILTETRTGLRATLRYASDCFDAATIERMAMHYQMLIQAIVQSADLPIDDLPLLTNREREQILVGWNTTARSYRRDQLVHQLFEECAALTPQAPAISDERVTLSYADLNCRANQLAAYLRRCGVGPETRVALCVDRSPDFIMGLLATLKAGGAYVPLDPAYPHDRLLFMLRDSQAAVLLTWRNVAERLPALPIKHLLLDEQQAAIAQAPAENLPRNTTPAHLAYVIYTSGSSGRPKGTAIEHQSLANLVHWHREAFAISPADRATQIASVGFDASVWEIWPYLCAGAHLLIPPTELRLAPDDLVAWLVAQAITVSFMPTPLAEQSLDVDWPEQTALRLLLTGGDRLHRRPRAGLPFRLFNNYGPTENTVVTTSGEVEAADEGLIAPPIGRPVANTRVYILDRGYNPVPINVAGELYIGGIGLAREYLNQPMLTAERFVADPFGDQPGARLYRTGDQVRYRADGQIEFLGRIDDQVKLRGYRIELGEIEAALIQREEVGEAIVFVHEGAMMGRALVAYVTSAAGYTLEGETLREALRTTLPEYMIPTQIILLHTLPLTANGKVDRHALPEPHLTAANDHEHIEPRNQAEVLLTNCFAQVLGAGRVSVTASFFDLGGDSLLVMRVVAVARRAGLPLKPWHLYQYKTVAQIAAALKLGQVQSAPAPDSRPPDTTALPVLTGQRNFLINLYPQHNSSYIHVNSFELLQPIDDGMLRQAIQCLLDHHDGLRMTFHQRDDQWVHELCAVHADDVLLREVIEDEVNFAGQLDALAHRLRSGMERIDTPLIRIALVEAPQGHARRLLIAFHHLISDGYSWEVLLSDFEQACCAAQQRAPFAPLDTTPYQTWVRYLIRRAQAEEAHQRALSAWSAIPWDEMISASLPSKDSVTVATCERVLDKRDVEGLRALQHTIEGCTFEDVLIAALATAYYQWTGKRHLLLNHIVSGRPQNIGEIDLSRTIGGLSIPYPLLIVVQPESALHDMIVAVVEQKRDALDQALDYSALEFIKIDDELKRRVADSNLRTMSFNFWGNISDYQGAGLLRESSDRITGIPIYKKANYLGFTGFFDQEAQARLRWTYATPIWRAEAIQQFVDAFMKALRGYLSHQLRGAWSDERESPTLAASLSSTMEHKQ